MNGRKLIWIVVALALVVLTFWAVLRTGDHLSLGGLLEALRAAHPGYLLLAGAAMLGFIVFEGEALLLILRSLGYRRSRGAGFLYSAADVYFSAVTPSASGGQPASAFFMLRGGVPGAAVTVTLLLNLVAYTAATLTVGLLALIFWPGVLFDLGTFPKLLIGLGFLILVGLIFLFYALLRRGKWIYGVGSRCIRLLCRLRLMRREEERIARLGTLVEEYEDCVRLFSGKRGTLLGVYLLDLAQRTSQALVTALTHLALGGRGILFGRIWASASYAQIGSGCLPVPGGMGVADYLLSSCFLLFFPRDRALELELISRSFSFYLCVALSGLITLGGYLYVRVRKGATP